MYKSIAVRLSFLAALVVVTVLVSNALLGGVGVVKLGSAPSLSGAVAQSLYAGQGQTTLPVPGQDFNLKNVRYFDNNSWVVARVVPTNQTKSNPSLVVMERRDGAYQAVLGPGSAFESSYLMSLPKDVGQYLQNQGVFYESSD